MKSTFIMIFSGTRQTLYLLILIPSKFVIPIKKPDFFVLSAVLLYKNNKSTTRFSSLSDKIPRPSSSREVVDSLL